MEEIIQRAQFNKIRAEDNGEEIQGVVGDVAMVVGVGPRAEREVQAEDRDVAPMGLIPWLATCVGCVAI